MRTVMPQEIEQAVQELGEAEAKWTEAKVKAAACAPSPAELLAYDMPVV